MLDSLILHDAMRWDQITRDTRVVMLIPKSTPLTDR